MAVLSYRRDIGPVLTATGFLMSKPDHDISDVDLLLFEDAADFRCQLIEKRSDRVVVQIAGVERQNLTSEDCNGFAVSRRR